MINFFSTASFQNAKLMLMAYSRGIEQKLVPCLRFQTVFLKYE